MKFLRDSRQAASQQGAGSPSSAAPSSDDRSSTSRPSSAEGTRKATEDATMQHSPSGAQQSQEHEGVSESKHSSFLGLRRFGSKFSRKKTASPSIPFFTRSSISRFHPMDNNNDSHNMSGSINSVPEEPEFSHELNNREHLHNGNGSPAGGMNGSQSHGFPDPSFSPENRSTSLPASFTPPRSLQTDRDAEGFSVRPESSDPITRAQREANESNSSHAGNITIRPERINEMDEAAEREAVLGMAEVLRNQARESKIMRASSTRGRRDVRNTIFVPNSTQPVLTPASITRPPTGSSNSLSVPGTMPQQPPSTPPPPRSPQLAQSPLRSESQVSFKPFAIPEETVAAPAIPRSSLAVVAHDDQTAASDTTSMYSSQATRGVPRCILHAQMTEPGLNASIVETVTAHFSGSRITQSVASGELALAYNTLEGEGSSDQRELVRLDNFDALEKIAANPSFVTENHSTDAERKGEYTVALPSISRPIPTVAFKYQVHLDPSNMSSYCPIIFRPLWRIRDREASVMINYAINPAFVSLSDSKSLVLHNLVLRVKLDTTHQDDTEPARATSVSMYPDTGAYFRRKHSCAMWKIPSFEIHSCAMWKIPSFEISPEGQNRFLARFETDLPGARPGKTEVKFDSNADQGKRLGIKSLPDLKPGKDPFADKDDNSNSINNSDEPNPGWRDVPTRRNLRMATYIASDR